MSLVSNKLGFERVKFRTISVWEENPEIESTVGMAMTLLAREKNAALEEGGTYLVAQGVPVLWPVNQKPD